MMKKIIMIVLIAIAMVVILISAYWAFQNMHSYSPALW